MSATQSCGFELCMTLSCGGPESTMVLSLSQLYALTVLPVGQVPAVVQEEWLQRTHGGGFRQLWHEGVPNINGPP